MKNKSPSIPLQCQPSDRRRRFKSFVREGNSPAIATVAKPKDWAYRRPVEERAKQIMPHRSKPVRLKPELWNQTQLSNFFRQEVGMIQESGWFITINIPSRKMSMSDQLRIMLLPSEVEFDISINKEHKHLVIESIPGA